jgi:hypothetical protein
LTGRLEQQAAMRKPNLLKFNMAGLSERELEDVAVKKLRTHPASGALACPFVLADMETMGRAGGA